MQRMTNQEFHSPRAVTVEAPGRLHLGFIDLNGGLGRCFGSLGLALTEPATRLTVRAARGIGVDGLGAERTGACAQRLLDALGLPGIHIAVESMIPDHVGLGSGTQLALALGTALSHVYGLGLSTRDIAALTDRGARSGIGVGTFESGGVLLDGGRGAEDAPPPVIARLPFPEHWAVILVFDARGQGLHGDKERDAFRRLAPFPAESAAHLSRLALMQILPAVAEQDLTRFGGGVAELQRTVGDYFAPAQGGRFASPAVGAALQWLDSAGAVGIGQSSWGPTGFAFVDDAARAEAMVREARLRLRDHAPLTFCVAGGRNDGARLTVHEHAQRVATHAPSHISS